MLVAWKGARRGEEEAELAAGRGASRWSSTDVAGRDALPARAATATCTCSARVGPDPAGLPRRPGLRRRSARSEHGRGAAAIVARAMGAVYAVANQKGGVGKTTTAVNLAACAAARRQQVLLVDLDQQCNATVGLGPRPRR